jgi:N4-gp56 family major capsid protein
MGTGNVTTTTIANWLPTHYSPELQFGTVEKSVIAQLVKRPDLEGLVSASGKTVEFGIISSNTARDKLVNTGVTYDQNTESKVTINLDQHKYLARIIEKRAEIQSMPAVMSSYGIQDSRSLAKAIDVYVSTLITSLTQNVGATTSAGAYSDITDAVIRNAIQKLDEAEAPEEDRYLVISPAQKNALLGIDKFVDASKFGSDVTIQKGFFGEIYGVRVFVSNNLPDTTSVASSSGASAILGRKNCVMFHKDAFSLVVQDDIDTILEDSADHIGIKMVSDAIFGASISRDLYGVIVRTTDEA